MQIDCENCAQPSPLDSRQCTHCAEPFGFLQKGDAQWSPNDYAMWLYAQHHQIYEKCLAQGLGALSEAERLNYLVGYLYYQVHNGGVWQYLTNPCATDAPQLVQALHEIGAPRHAQALAACLSHFPAGGPPSDQEARDEIVDAIPDDAANELAARVSNLVCGKKTPEKLLVLLRRAVTKLAPTSGPAANI